MNIEAETFAGAAGFNMEEGSFQEPRNIRNAAPDAEKAEWDSLPEPWR